MSESGASRLAAAIERARNFIAERQSSDFLWRDFKTLAGLSSDWVTCVTCYVASLVDRDRLSAVSSLQEILRRQRRNGGWAYNREVPTDCDSTAWALLALSTAPSWRPSAILRAVQYLKRHQNELDGGFRTYASEDRIGAYIGAADSSLTRGWEISHPCVTALAVQSMAANGEGQGSAVVRKAADYLLDKRNKKWLWESYWWKGYGYPTYHALRALVASRRFEVDGWRRACDALLADQKDDGGWNDAGDTDSEVFPTAWNTLSLLLLPEERHRAGTGRGIAWLLSRQRRTGDWPTAPILRIPPPMAMNPEEVETWRKDDLGTGVVIADQNGIFTATAALWALSAYGALYQDSFW